MKFCAYFAFFAFYLSSQIFSFADENPWIAEVEKAVKDKRYAGRPLTEEECNIQREMGALSGCVNREHLPYLVSKEACPLCTFSHTPAGVSFIGCFAEGTRIWVEEKITRMSAWVPIEKLVDSPDQFLVWALSGEMNVENPRFEKLEIARPIQGPEHALLVALETSKGQRISLTEEHPVLLANGQVVKAKRLGVGDLLLSMNGVVEIIQIRREPTQKDVYNLMTTGVSGIEHVIVAEGLLMGDRKWQNIISEMDDPLQLF